MDRIYTKSGDQGTAVTLSGVRCPKSEPIFEMVGTLDEVNSFVGLAASMAARELLEPVQNDLFEIGLSIMSQTPFAAAEERVSALEREIDRMQAENKPLRNFILPGGSTPAATVHCARAVCRRAERLLVRHAADATVIRYMNRLSDFLFVLARNINTEEDRFWRRPG